MTIALPYRCRPGVPSGVIRAHLLRALPAIMPAEPSVEWFNAATPRLGT